ncbi:phosphatidylinositol phosphate synthase [Bifidobacterium catenulatum subsp. kashiwanohense]|uniref:phosphatidylinositol phosphate synthase n=1 Tax=Bifidobacterium catenulatum TaxID=1686 RepID=UPI002430C974|nr:CDP-alcohol phosphatidyltransferase family protein [Bifidobacterium catenulatum]
MLEHLRAPFKKLIEPLAKALISIGLTANAVTVIGTIGTIVVAFVTGITGWLFAGAVVLTLLVLADSLDGSIAKLTTGDTQFGAFLDSTLDRIADWALLAGVIVFFILHADWWYDISRSSPDYISWVGVGAAMVSMMTSFVTSYARARAESVGFEVKNGIATRADRLVIILVGMAITGLTHHGLWLAIDMVLLAVLGVVTVFQRVLEARRQMTSGHRTYQL